MESEITEKIQKIFQNSTPSESEVSHLFTLYRKLMEKILPTEREKYALLRFYCDWTVHGRIDRSAEGAKAIERVNDVLIGYMGHKNVSTMPIDLTQSLSPNSIPEQMSDLLKTTKNCEFEIELINDWWKRNYYLFCEIVSSCPLKIDPKKSKILNNILTRILNKPTPKGSVLEQVEIIRMPVVLTSDGPIPSAGSETIIFHICLTLSDTTRIIAPIVTSF